MDNRPHIVIYGAIYAGVGGIERNLLQLVRHLAPEYRFTVLCQAGETFREQIQAAGAAWQSIEIPPAFSPKAIIALARQLKNELYADLVHSLDPRGCTVACPAGRLAGLPTVHRHSISALDYEETSGLRWLIYCAGEAVLGWGCIDAGIFVAEKVRQRYVRLKLAPYGRSHYIPNSVHLDIVQSFAQQRESTRAQLGVSKDEFMWVHMGRLVHQKAHDIILDAIARLPKTGRWRLILVGEGVQRSYIESQIQQSNLQDVVQLLGALPHAAALEILGAADGLVFPSRYENMANTVLEAMAMGIPLIVTDVGDSWYISGGGELPPASLLVPVDDPETLAQTMKRLMSDPQLHAQLKVAGLPRTIPFTEARTIQNTASLYERLLHRKSSR